VIEPGPQAPARQRKANNWILEKVAADALTIQPSERRKFIKTGLKEQDLDESTQCWEQSFEEQPEKQSPLVEIAGFTPSTTKAG